MMLVDMIRRLPPDKVLALTPSRQWTTPGFLEARNRVGASQKGLRIGIGLSDMRSGLETTNVADGLARAITLIRRATPDRNIGNLLDGAQCNVLISSQWFCRRSLPKDIRADGSFEGLARQFGRLRRESELQNTKWHLATSGTPGNPKLVGHSLASSNRTVRRVQTDHVVTRSRLWYDYKRFAALQLVLQALFTSALLIAARLRAPMAKTIAMLSNEAGVPLLVKDGRALVPASYLKAAPAGLTLRILDGQLQIRNTNVLPTCVGTLVAVLHCRLNPMGSLIAPKTVSSGPIPST